MRFALAPFLIVLILAQNALANNLSCARLFGLKPTRFEVAASQLQTMEITKTVPFSRWQARNTYGGDKWIGTLSNGKRVLIKEGTEIIRDAFDGESNTYPTPPRYEAAAYLISRAMGSDIVPPTVVRQLRIDGVERTVSVQLWVENAKTISTYQRENWRFNFSWSHYRNPYERRYIKGSGRDRDEAARLIVFDAIIGNIDRHPANGIIDRDGRLIAIDNSLAFGTNHSISIDIPITHEMKNWVRLLDDATLATLNGLLTPEELSGIKGRRDRFLSWHGGDGGG